MVIPLIIWVPICYVAYVGMSALQSMIHFDIVAIIASESEAHIQREAFHFFHHHTRRWMDIIMTKDNFRTLVNVVIVDSICPKLVQCTSTTSHVVTIVAQDKAWSYIEQVLGDDFIPLAIKTYSCLCPCFDSFLISCVHVCIVCHQQTPLVPLMFISLYKQWVSIALQHAQAIAILQWVATFSESSSSLPHIPANAPPSLVDLWQRTFF
jgi:hypothetical protein